MSIALAQLMPLVTWTVLFAVPFFVLLPKLGYSRLWLLFLRLPLFGSIISFGFSQRPSDVDVFQ